MIVLDEITKIYDKEPVFKNLSLRVDRGDMAFITGPSGAGKTTLLKLIYGAERPDKGEIIVGEWHVTKLKQKKIPLLRQEIGIVFQDFRLLPNKTVFDNVALALTAHKLSPAAIRETVNNVLRDIILLHRKNSYPLNLSGGEQQRVVIARAMVAKPKIILADEPTGNLDSVNANTIMGLFKDINAKGTTVMIVTHNEELYQGTGHRVFHINNKIVEREFAG